ncbi:hypothetical protein LOTGIDRAFT_124430, partial [Lottia gigantea]
DGNWGPWFPWHPCSSSCGGGTRIRQRKCNYPPPAYNGKNCEGLAEEDDECNIDDCPEDGGFSLWSNWGQCDVTCGGGYKARTRACDSPPPLYGGKDCEGEREELKRCNAARPCPGTKC